MSYAKGILDKNNFLSTPYLREGFVNVSLIKYINLKKMIPRGNSDTHIL